MMLLPDERNDRDEVAAASPTLAGDDDSDSSLPAFEIKFLLDDATASKVQAWARRHLRADPHGETPDSGEYGVTTLYLDTTDFAVFHRSPELGGAKHRVRRYGSEPHCWLERKVRRGNSVRKRRVRVALDAVAKLAGVAAPLAADGRVADWFEAEVRHHALAPVCAIAYRRTAFFGSGDQGGYRMTLDRGIAGVARAAWDVADVRDGVAIASASINGSHAPPPIVCELKFRDALPNLFKQLVAELLLESSSFSKYRRTAGAVGLVKAAPTDAR